jgi:hypothetical protein
MVSEISIARFTWMFCAAGLVASCGSDSENTASTGEGAGGGTEQSASFPESLAVSSPLAHLERSTAADAQTPEDAQRSLVLATAQTRSLISDQADIEAVLADATQLATLLDMNAFFSIAGRADCYGPALDYSGHPDASGGPDSGQLPTGDLGIWQETQDDEDADGVAEACAAAQLNARMEGMEPRNKAALMVLAAVYAQHEDDGTTDISAHLPSGVTASNDSLTVSGDISQIQIELNYDHDTSGTDESIELTMLHYQSSSDAFDNEGLLNVSVEDTFNGGNCGPGENDILRYNSVHYVQSSANAIALQVREANACAAGASAFAEPVEAVNTGVTGQVLDPDAGWSDNFSVFTAEFDPTPDSTGELEGRFTFAWQAGNGDSHSRILNVGLSAGVGGESWFGFGDRVQEVTAVDEFGVIQGMICNWAGPGSDHSPQDYAQRQHLSLDTTVGFYVPSNSGASDITYAPTNSCLYDDSGSFDYDRDLNGTLDGSDEVAVGEGYAGASLGLDFDLMDVGDGRTDIWDTILNDRNFRLPAYPE